MSEKSNVEQYYDLLANEYDLKTTGKFLWTPPSEANQLLDPYLMKNVSLLDVGVGTGQTVELALQRECHVTVVDISQKMLAIVTQKFPEVETIKADLSKDLKVLDHRLFHIVSAIGVLEFVPDLQSTLKKLAQYLHVTGLMCFTFEELIEKHEHQGEKILRSAMTHYRYTLEEVKEMLKELDLKLIRAKHFQAYLKSEKMIPVYYQIILAKKL